VLDRPQRAMCRSSPGRRRHSAGQRAEQSDMASMQRRDRRRVATSSCGARNGITSSTPECVSRSSSSHRAGRVAESRSLEGRDFDTARGHRAPTWNPDSSRKANGCSSAIRSMAEPNVRTHRRVRRSAGSHRFLVGHAEDIEHGEVRTTPCAVVTVEGMTIASTHPLPASDRVIEKQPLHAAVRN